MQITLSRIAMAVVAVTMMAVAGWSRAADEGVPRQHVGAIAGVVTDAHGHAVAGALVTLEDAHHQLIAKTTTGHDGRFQFPHVRPGRYIVRASKAHVGHGSAVVDVHAGHTTHVHIVLR